MSGDKKKRSSKGQGWEEAKDEFYQESYPTDVDLDFFEKDPKKIATLLPSKQSRGTISTRRINKNAKEKGTTRRRTSNRSANANDTARRQSVTQDNVVSMLPDLSENLSTEETTWEQIMMIKAAPVSLAQKKEMKANLQNSTKLRLQGYDQFKWRRRKFIQHLKAQYEEASTKIELWKNSLKNIEGRYGTGVVTYFQFIKWLIFLNIGIFILLLLFVIIPTLSLDQFGAGEACFNITAKNPVQCYGNYTEAANATSISDLIIDFVQGTGWMENTYLFYGLYECYVLVLPGETPHFYNLPFAYILVTISIFIISLFCTVKSAAGGFRERLLEGEGQYYQFCNLVFGGWDFCIQNEKSAGMKHKALHTEIKSLLFEERQKEEAKMRTNDDATKLMILRFLIHILVLLLLAASATLIYFASSLSKQELEDSSKEFSQFERLLLEFVPSFTIVALNTLVPIFLRYV